MRQHVNVKSSTFKGINEKDDDVTADRRNNEKEEKENTTTVALTKAKARSNGKGTARGQNNAVAAPTEAAGDDTPKNNIF